MIKSLLMGACGGLAAACAYAADGTWINSAGTGGSWNDPVFWADGILPGDGGKAIIYFDSGMRVNRLYGVGDDVTLSELQWTTPPVSDHNYASIITDKHITLVPPAKIVRAGGALTFGDNTLASDCDVTVSGFARTIINPGQQIRGKIILKDKAWVRAVSDSSFGPAPATLVPDAISINDATLQNGGTTILAATRGIVVGEAGGAFTAGYTAGANLTIHGPITGPGEVRIPYENSPVIFTNPDNAWCGDTRVGTEDVGLGAWSNDFCLRLGADEVIPHGEGKGILYLAPLATYGVTKYSRAELDLNGHTETVNSVNSTWRGGIVSRNAPGVIKTCDAQDMDFRGAIATNVTLELRGTGRMTLAALSANVGGVIELHSGSLDFAAAAFKHGSSLLLMGGTPTVLARFNETNATLRYESAFDGNLFVGTDTTLTIDEAAEPFVFRGVLATDAQNPATLTVANDGRPFVIGGMSATSSAVFGAPVNCAGGIVMKDFVWLKNAITEGTQIEEGTIFTYDYDGVLAQDQTLSGDMRVASASPGNGTVTIPSGRKLIFTTQCAEGGELVDPIAGTRTYANNIVLAGGTLVFDGAGTTYFNGSVSGSGTIRQEGTGTVVLADGQNITSGTTIVIANGTLRVPATCSLGAAKIHLSGGLLANVAGESVMLPNFVIANSGGFKAEGATDAMTFTGVIENWGPVSKYGTGTLRIIGEESTDPQIYVRGGTLALSKSNAVKCILGCLPDSVVRLEAEGAVDPDGYVSLSGGKLDMNGYDLPVKNLVMSHPESAVLNDTATAVTFTVTEDANQEVQGSFIGAVRIVKQGGGEWDFTHATLDNDALSVCGGNVILKASETVLASQIRFTTTKTRPTGTHVGSGVQMSEFRLMLNGVQVPWPEGTTATSPNQSSTANEGPGKAIDTFTSTKWYDTQGRALTITMPDVVEFDSYQFVTANDATGRDPVSWTVEVGHVDNGTNVWTLLDKQTDQMDFVPTDRHTASYSYSVSGSMAYSLLSEGYDLNISAPGKVTFISSGDVLTNLSGDGTLVALGSFSPTIATGSAFAGNVSGEMPVALDFNSATIPGILPADEGTVLENNGIAGSLTFADAGEIVNNGAFADGKSSLGLMLTGDTAMTFKGIGSTHTGVTSVGAGATWFAGCGCNARYFRFTLVRNVAGTDSNMQLSEIKLMFGGGDLAWPAGTTAVSSGDSSSKDEGAKQLIDGKINTKCYWAGGVFPVLITLPESVFFDGYCWYSANDMMTVRNPARWKFEYSEDGEKWTTFDDRSREDVTTVTTANTLAYTYNMTGEALPKTNYVSDFSPMSLADGATGTISGIDETLGALSGAGMFNIMNCAAAHLNVTADSSFSGTISGAGTLVKNGAAKQTLSGEVALAGELVVEEGELNLDGAVLTGVTNIVLKGGVLTGTANVAGDVTITSEGGAYGANLAVSGALTLNGVPEFATGFTDKPVRGTAFTFTSVDTASRALFVQALSAETLPKGWRFNLRVSDTQLFWSVTPGGTVLFVR